MIRLLLVEDQGMLRGAMAQLLAMEGDLEVVAEAEDGLEAVAVAERVEPDVALVDIELPGQDGLAVAEQIAGRLPSCRVLIVTTFGRPGYLRRAMDAGAAGFVLKDAPVSELAEIIRRVHRGERVVDPQLAISALHDGDSPLTVREREVVAAARDHRTVTEVAAHLHLSEGTVRNHLSAVIQKLGVRSRGEAIAVAQEKGWL